MKKATFIRLLSLALVLVMIVPMVISCGDGGSEKLTILFDPGDGDLADDEYEMTIDKGTRLTKIPTPTRQGYTFLGWYEESDTQFTNKLSKVDTINSDKVYVARWEQQAVCSITLTTTHANFTPWDYDDPNYAATCTEPGRAVRFCDCGFAETLDQGKPALGHLWGDWKSGVMKLTRECSRVGCPIGKEIKNFTDVTMDALGKNKPYFSGTTDGYGLGKVSTCLTNATWFEENSGTFDIQNCVVDIMFDFETPTQIDLIYVKGHGTSQSFIISVLYQGDTEYTELGSRSTVSYEVAKDPDGEVPYVETKSERLITNVKIHVEAGFGGTYWDEVAFAQLPEN